MDIRTITTETEIAEAAGLAAARHDALRAALPFLPPRAANHYRPKLDWMAREGLLMGLYDGAGLTAFYGDFIIENFRNLGPGSFSPDWSHGHRAAPDQRDYIDIFVGYRQLYRELARRRLAAGINIHSVALYATESAALEAFGKTGFGGIVMDAARPTVELAAELAADGRSPAGHPTLTVRRAGIRDAGTLESLQARLAAHIGDAPVSMPDAHGQTAAEWAEWLAGAARIALIAEAGAKAVGFIKAEAPQFDVSDVVHDPLDLGINGMYVDPARRGEGIGSRLLRLLIDIALAEGKTLMSVDCETTNLEAYAFWTRYFRPTSWSLERRI